MRPSPLFFLPLLFLGGLLPAKAAEVQFGFLLRPGDTHAGIPLVRPALYSGIVASVDPAGFRILDRSYPPIEARKLSGWGLEPCYLEIESCPANRTLEGERWEVDTGRSLSMPGYFALKAESWNTRPDLPRDLAGAIYSIRPHWTLDTLMSPVRGSDVLRSSRSGDADRVAIFDPAHPKSYRRFFAREVSPAGDWEWSAVDPKERNSRVIPPGHGWAFRREADHNLNLGLTGEPRACALRVPLRKGMNLVAPGYLRTTSLRQFAQGPAYGFRPGAKPGLADRISLFRREAVDTFALLDPGWTSLRSLRGVDPEVAMQVRPGEAVQIQKVEADADFVFPLQP